MGMYAYGRGVAKDEAEAVIWYRKAAEQGYPSAQWSLGFAYYHGEGVPQDYVEAHKWVNLSTVDGLDSEAVKSRDLIANKMTAEQIAEAQKLAREWKPKKAQGK